MSGRAETWARTLTPVAVMAVFAVAVAVGVAYIAPEDREARNRTLVVAPRQLERIHDGKGPMPDVSTAELRRRYDELAEEQRELRARSGEPESGRVRRGGAEGKSRVEATSHAAASMRGVVQAVDDKAGLYVVSLGSKDGVQVGMEFTVRRGSDRIGSIVIDKVFPDHASASRSPGSPAFSLQADDVCTAAPRTHVRPAK